MSEETAPVDHEETVFNELQKEYAQLCAQAGEKQYVIRINQKELLKMNIRLRKINQKAQKMIEAKKLRDAAKQKPTLSVVPPEESKAV